MRKGRVKKFYSLFLAILIMFGTASVALAAGYTTHEQVPGAGTTSDFPTFLRQLYNFGIGSAAILAMITIGAGAFIYIVTSAGNASKMATGKDMIMSALYGLIIAMIAYLILFLVNPDLVNSTINNVPQVSDCIDGTC